jgi:DUF1707 SHOCT-like domain
MAAPAGSRVSPARLARVDNRFTDDATSAMPESPRDAAAGPPAALSIDSAARDRVVDILTRGFAEDRLTEAELESGLDAVYRAGTRAELDALIATLPAPVEPAAVARPSLPAGYEPPRRIRAVFSGQELSLAVVPRHLRVRARFGYVELDLTHASFEPGVTEINLRAFMGYVQLRLPAGVRVESHGRGLFGYFSARGSGSTDPESPVVRIRGRALFGFVECHVAREGGARSERLGPGEHG